MFKHSLLVLLLLLSQAVFSGEHGMGRIISKDVDLHTYDHSFAGKFKESVIWGNVDEGKFVSSFVMKKFGQVIKVEVTKKDSEISGKINYTKQNQKIVKEVKFISLNTNQNIYTLKVNDKTIEVSVTADDFQNNHFINPVYSGNIDGELVSFKFNGKACYRYSLGLIMLLYGANTIQ